MKIAALEKRRANFVKCCYFTPANVRREATETGCYRIDTWRYRSCSSRGKRTCSFEEKESQGEMEEEEEEEEERGGSFTRPVDSRSVGGLALKFKLLSLSLSLSLSEIMFFSLAVNFSYKPGKLISAVSLITICDQWTIYIITNDIEQLAEKSFFPPWKGEISSRWNSCPKKMETRFVRYSSCCDSSKAVFTRNVCV